MTRLVIAALCISLPRLVLAAVEWSVLWPLQTVLTKTPCRKIEPAY
jgi:hypothetical protein